MKKILLSVVAVLAVFSAMAQDDVKSVAAATKSLQSAREATENPKKNTKMATWFKYGEALVDAYAAPMGNVYPGITAEELAFLNDNAKPLSEETVEVLGAQYTKKVFPTCNYYFSTDGKLEIVEVTKVVEEKALPQAIDAFAKAASLDNGSKSKDLVGALKNVNGKLIESASNSYRLGRYEESSYDFEYAAKALATAPSSQIDTNSIYNAAIAAQLAGNDDRAKVFYEKCANIGYYGDDGVVYYKLSEIATKKGDQAESLRLLQEGFVKMPESQMLLIGLINYYVTSGENSDEIFVLLDKAKANDPSNVSLYQVEGDIHKKLGETDQALASYDKCISIDPNYEYGYIGKGILYYDQAVEYQALANEEMDDAKWKVLDEKFEESLKACIPPFEKAFDVTKDETVKKGVSEYLKNACYRFISEGDEYQQKYDKYKNYLEQQ